MEFLIYSSILILWIYVSWTIVEGGKIPRSISATYYMLEHPIIFSVILWASGLLLLPPMLYASPENIQFLSFLSVSGLILVGAAPMIKLDIESTLHNIFAAFAVICSQIWIAFMSPRLLEVWGLYLFALLIYMVISDIDDFKKRFVHFNPVFWAEIVALTIIYTCLLGMF